VTTACFLDFDHTLFDTDKFFRIDVHAAFLTRSAQVWQQSYDAVRPTGYSLQKHADEFRARVARVLNTEILQSFADLTRYVYPDVVPFLQQAQQQGTPLYLLSFGNADWQQYKVEHSGLAPYFHTRFYTASEGKKGEVVRQCQADRIIVVDDKSAELDAIKDAVPQAETYLINRTIPVTTCTRHKICTSLAEIIL